MTASTMTPEAQRIAIAGACGWKPLHHSEDDPSAAVWFNAVGGRKLPKQYGGGVTGTIRTGLPVYLNDLNAMHEAEKVLKNKTNEDQWVEYGVSLTFMVAGAYQSDCAHATAAQRAEAFLRTIGKWTDA